MIKNNLRKNEREDNLKVFSNKFKDLQGLTNKYQIV